MKRIMRFLGVLCFICGLVILLWGKRFEKSGSSVRANLIAFNQAMNIVVKNYVCEVDPTRLLEDAMRGMLQSLDPYSVYLDAKELSEFEVHTKGRFGGLGIRIDVRDGWITVISPIEGTPAYRAGLLPGDKIVEIEGESTRGMTVGDAVKVLRGKPGTDVTITIAREGVDEPFEVTITRALINIPAVQYAGIIEDGIGYIRLSDFSANAYREFAYYLDSLEGEGACKFIVDLRNNPGGLLDQAVDIAGCFVGKNREIVTVKGRDRYGERVIRSRGWDEGFPVVVLVNGASASASEIVAGAIQDWDRGLIIGTRTYGKGSVQNIFELSNGGAVKLTTAKYYTPSGRCIDRTTHGEVVKIDSSEVDTTKVYRTVGELKREVHGGGGINPDILVEEKDVSSLVKKIYAKGAFFDFAVWYTARYDVGKRFSVDDKVWQMFIDFLREKGVEFWEDEIDACKEEVERFLYLAILETKWGIKARYAASLMDDEYVMKALEVLRNAEKPEDVFKF